VLSGNATGASSLQWRFNAWSALWQFFIDKPIFGQGFGATRNLNLAGAFLPHNEYLRLLIETGIVGIMFFAVFSFSIFFKVYVNVKKTLSELQLITFSLLIAFYINAFSENTFTYTVPMYVLALFVGSCYSQEIKGVGNDRQKR
jgi:O-antigen ligase